MSIQSRLGSIHFKILLEYLHNMYDIIISFLNLFSYVFVKYMTRSICSSRYKLEISSIVYVCVYVSSYPLFNFFKFKIVIRIDYFERSNWYRNISSIIIFLCRKELYRSLVSSKSLYVIKIMTISIRALKRTGSILQTDIFKSGKAIIMWSSAISWEIDFPLTNGNSRTWFSENFSKRILEGWSVR